MTPCDSRGRPAAARARAAAGVRPQRCVLAALVQSPEMVSNCAQRASTSSATAQLPVKKERSS
eukprot:10099449-Alexandrium_andersonii.AAC.1